MSSRSIICAAGFIYVAALSFLPQAFAHESDGDAESEATSTAQSATLELPPIEGDAKPWSGQSVLNDARRFHFVVMTDRTGGHRPGVWMHGVRSVNLLRPEFVVSVGDLIEGYTEDVDEIQRQWKEFLGFIDQLDMRFFFVSGNHDATNPTMHKIWREHFGREWYSFDYKDVHFVCLQSEDPSDRIGPEQLEWVLNDLSQNQDVRWTFVFLHKPLWAYAERALAAGNPDSTNWKQVEAALGSRPHTVFAGHIHSYVQYKRGGHEYYQLATTGGGSQLRGEPYGEFDHVTWVTMEPDGPRIANILLDGVLEPDVVTEESITRFRKFLADARFRVDPILLEPAADFASAELDLSMLNEFDGEIQVDARVEGLPFAGLTLEPAAVSQKVPAHDSLKATFRMQFTQPIDIELLRRVVVNVKARTTTETAPLLIEQSLPVLIDSKHFAPRLAVDVDGNLDEWEGDLEAFSAAPATLGASQQWQGLGDGSVTFRVAQDAEHIYFGGVVIDDAVVAGRDRLLFRLDVRPMSARVADPRLGDHSLTVQLRPSRAADNARVRVRSGRRNDATRLAGARVALRPNAQGYAFELAIPSTTLIEAQGTEWESFQLNVVMLDVDEANDEDLQILWRSGTGDGGVNTNYAHFFAVE